ncbi:hypothetical protein G9A89_019593 [Geosiphon pyriformis]|nr:hypothetical protein G9A89_019593 [Geosiphon pyriformis]
MSVLVLPIIFCQKLDPCGPVPEWFKLSVVFLGGLLTLLLALIGVSPLNICESSDFVSVRNCFSQVGSDSLSVYTDGSLKNLGTLDCWGGTAVFFEDINLGLGVSVYDLVSSTLVELQAIVLALECMLKLHSVHLFSDNQAALDVCKLELGLMCSDFCNWLSSALFKGFVFDGWFPEAVSVFHDPKIAGVRITDFVRSLCLAFRDDIWLVCAKHRAFMEKYGLIPMDSLALTSISGSVLKFSTGVIKLLGMSVAFRVCFGFCKHCLFFSGIDFSVSVVITA